ncbi:MAG TPA: septum site-determining protein MinC [Gammaproteobacteria bacterium]
MTEARASRPVLEFKGRMMTLTILRLMHSSVELLAREVDRRVKEAPGLFKQLPVIVDVSEVAGTDLHADLPGFVELLRTRGLVPIGIRGGDSRFREAAFTAGLSVFSNKHLPDAGDGEREAERESAARSSAESAKRSAPAEAEPRRERAALDEPAPAAGSLTVTQPVRSGQQIYARGTDLVILAAVSPGAEVLADGHVHVYGALNGRALAGVRGNTNARIFCKSFRAELVSIAGIYGLSEQFDASLAGLPAQVSLQGDTLRIERL